MCVLSSLIVITYFSSDCKKKIVNILLFIYQDLTSSMRKDCAGTESVRVYYLADWCFVFVVNHLWDYAFQVEWTVHTYRTRDEWAVCDLRSNACSTDSYMSIQTLNNSLQYVFKPPCRSYTVLTYLTIQLRVGVVFQKSNI